MSVKRGTSPRSYGSDIRSRSKGKDTAAPKLSLRELPKDMLRTGGLHMSLPHSETKKQQRAIRMQIMNTQDTYCKGCATYSDNLKKLGHYKTDQHCISQCHIGAELKRLGKMLDTNEPGRPTNKITKSVDEQEYKKLKVSGLSDKKIEEMLGVSRETLRRRKKKWENDNQQGYTQSPVISRKFHESVVESLRQQIAEKDEQLKKQSAQIVELALAKCNKNKKSGQRVS